MRDRILGFSRVPASTLTAHPDNWRRHPDFQRRVLADLLQEIGMADALLVRELHDGRLQLLDGHLRAETCGDQLVPVLMLDLDDAEAAKLIASLDPLASLAESDQAAWDNLRQSFVTDSDALERMFQQMFSRASEEEFAPEKSLDQSFSLMVECRDEADQRDLYERLVGEGFSCRVLTM